MYKLVFRNKARKAFDSLDHAVRLRFQKKLAERLSQPRVASAALSEMRNCYKIKLHSVGYRLIYRVEDDRLVVLVLAIGERDRLKAYKLAEAELARLEK